MASKQELIQNAKAAVLAYNKDAAKKAANESIQAKISPVEMINEGFAKAMTEVGDLYAAGKLYLPFVLAASEAMQAGVDVLTPELEKMGGANQKSLGTAALGTIEGDIHTIGKDIVCLMLKVAGFKVINLGRDVPIDKFVEAARNGADVIGSSALMTSSMMNQPKIEEAFKEEGLKGKCRTMVGGAPTSQGWADKIGADIWAENAGDAVNRLKGMR